MSSRRFFLAAGIMIVAAAFRLGGLGSDSLWLDEAFSVRLALQHSAVELWTDAAPAECNRIYETRH